jgi:hypothetical protein
MELLKMKNNILDVLKELNKGKRSKLTKKQYEQAKKNINKKMEKFRIEHNAYMAYSIESAKHTYITF